MIAIRIAAALAVLALAASATPAIAGTIPVVRVSRPDEEAMQAQNPTWCVRGVERPALTFEVNDRSRRIYLRVASRDGEQWAVQDVPLVAAGAPGSFLLSDEWADRSVAWADARGFFFTRTLDSRPQLYYYDVAPHRVPWELGAVEDPSVSPDGATIVVAATDDSGTELHAAPTGHWAHATTLTSSPSVV